MKKYLSITVIIITVAILVCVFAVWKLHSNAPAIPPTAGSANYVVRDGKVYWQVHMQVQWDDNQIHNQLKEWEIKEAEAKTFKALGGDWGWGKDAARVFYQGTLAMPASSTPTTDISMLASVPNSYFLKDSYAVYFPVYSSHNEGWTYTVLVGADSTTFGATKNMRYAKDKNYVYYLGSYDDNHAIEGLDPKTFRVVGECGWAETYNWYAVADSQSVYIEDQPVAGADPETFQIVGMVDNNPGGLSTGTGYAKDKNHVYKGCTEIVPGINPVQCTADNLKGCEAQ